MTLLKKIQECGYQDWATLAKDIKNAGLGTTNSGYIYPSGIIAWLEFSLGLSKEDSENIFNALVKMGYLTYNTSGNIYP